MLPTIRQLQYLKLLAEHGAFGKAAEACYVSQPTLSVAVKKLEEELDVKLFERSAGEVSVTGFLQRERPGHRLPAAGEGHAQRLIEKLTHLCLVAEGLRHANGERQLATILPQRGDGGHDLAGLASPRGFSTFEQLLRGQLGTVVGAPSDLQLRTASPLPNPTPEQRERMLVIFDMLISLFERAFLVAWKPEMTPSEQRRWNSWDDYMREWCRRDDFYNTLPVLLRGEDAAFQNYLRRVAQEERASPILTA